MTWKVKIKNEQNKSKQSPWGTKPKQKASVVYFFLTRQSCVILVYAVEYYLNGVKVHYIC